jgi:RNase P/RNase MRP subunit p30
MTRFADLHLEPPFGNPTQTRKLIATAKELNYGLVGVTLPPEATKDAFFELRATCKEYSIDLASRIDLSPRSPDELLRSLKRVRRQYEIVAVTCRSKAVARQAAKDHRVDLLAFPSSDPRERFFDRAETRVASHGVAALEIDMSLLLKTTGFARARLLYFLRRESATAHKARFPVVISSHAADPLLIRGPHDYASLAGLFGMDKASAMTALSTTPWGIVERNRAKLDPGYVARGVHVVRRGRDCDK